LTASARPKLDLAAVDGLDFNDFDAALWEAFGEALLAGFLATFLAAAFGALPDFFAAALRTFAAGFFAAAVGPPRAVFAAVRFAGVLEDFLRVFLDIRLPFVAFRGSTNKVLRVSSRAIGFVPTAGQV